MRNLTAVKERLQDIPYNESSPEGRAGNRYERGMNMEEKNRYKDIAGRYLPMLEQYVPVVDRVHGASHPEFHEVRSLFEEILWKSQAAGEGLPAIGAELEALKKLTGGYRVPEDVCESYEAVYAMLAALDQAYQS